MEAEEENSKQLVANKLAKLAVSACARLAGLIDHQDLASPKNPVIEESLSAMITPYIVSKMRENKTEDILKLLNSNVESPYLIWDNGTRAELTDFLDNERTNSVRRGTCDPRYYTISNKMSLMTIFGHKQFSNDKNNKKISGVHKSHKVERQFT